MSFLDVINSLRLNDVDRGAKNQEQLSDLRERATYLAKTTGQEPVSWHEFKQHAPKETPNTLRNLLIGAAIGLAIGTVVGMIIQDVVMPAIAAALVGSAVGGFSDTENKRRNSLVKQYEAYLDNFEMAAGKGRAPSMEISGLDTIKTNHAADILVQRQQMQGIKTI